MKNKNNIRALLAAVLGAVLMFLLGQCPAEEPVSVDQATVAALEDSLSTFRNERDELVIQTVTMEGTIADLLRAANHGDSLVDVLRAEAKRHKRMRDATVFTTQNQMHLPIVYELDTIRDTIPIFFDGWNDVAIVPADTAKGEEVPQLDIKIRDRVNVLHHYGKKPHLWGLLGARPLLVEVTNSNPNVEVTGMRSFAIPKYVPRWKFWKRG